MLSAFLHAQDGLTRQFAKGEICSSFSQQQKRKTELDVSFFPYQIINQ
jgi:hypothetical protein